MRKPDDCSLTPEQLSRIRAEARRALAQADALGRFPTAVQDIMAAVKVHEISDPVLDESFVAKMRKKAGAALKSALGKILGLFDARARLVFINRALLAVKKTFIRLHETGHGFLAWHRDLYAVVEENEQTISPEIAELFDREANAFASEVLFQLESFTEDASKEEFGILVLRCRQTLRDQQCSGLCRVGA